MRLARYSIIILYSLILASCAQVGKISGGDKDSSAPKPLFDKATPPNASLHFSSKSVTIPFDEFIRLNKPSQNIVMVPPHATINASVKGKNLTLEWDEELKTNTTYSIYLNEAVRDITESNDSVLQYVFSTGSTIDSLSYGAYIIDAWKQTPVAGVTLGLFDKATGEIINFSKTGSNGYGELNYLKEGNYTFVCFKDDNNNLEIDDTELVAFKNDSEVSIQGSTVDSIPYRLFQPLQKPRLRTVRYLAPGSIILGANSKIENENIFVDGQKWPREDYRFLSEDSLLVFVDELDAKTIEVVLQCDAIQDTASVRISSAGLEVPFQMKFDGTSKEIAPSEEVYFACNDKITSIDTSLVSVYNSQDSTQYCDYKAFFKANQLFFELNRDSVQSVVIEFDPGAITCSYVASTYHISRLSLNPARKYGTFIMDLQAYENPILLDVISKGKLVKQIACNTPQESISITELKPGEYTFRVIHDVNNNSKWDTGSLEKRTQPEVVDLFSTPVQLRANWDVSVPLIPNK